MLGLPPEFSLDVRFSLEFSLDVRFSLEMLGLSLEFSLDVGVVTRVLT